MAETLTREVRRIRLLGGWAPLGALAATDIPHPHVPDGWTGTTCLACFGWCSDVRHLGQPALAGGA